jgi:putative oxidoreductase
MLARFLGPRADLAYTVMRVVAGSMFTFHGMQKILGVLSDHSPAVGSQLWFGGIIELVGGLAIAAGAWTRCFAFVASGTMAVAYLQFHWRFAFGKAFFPAINKGELALLYAFVFLFVACKGGGPWSVDQRLRASPPPRA